MGPAPVTVTGTCRESGGIRRVQATADLCWHPVVAAGHRLLRVREARLLSRAPTVAAGCLQAQFRLEFRCDALGPNGARAEADHCFPILLTAPLPAGWSGPGTVEPVRSRITGAAITPEGGGLLAGVHLSVRLG